MCDLPLTYFWERSHNPMADKYNGKISESLARADAGFEPYAFAAALFFYNSESSYKNIPRHLKYEGGLDSGRFFAGMLGARLASSAFFSDVDVIMPVPLHWSRRWKRGYNQAEIIGAAISGAYSGKAVMRTDVLWRRRRTRTQTKLSLGEKGSNVAGAFDLRRNLDMQDVPRHILLVDDTFTTGATLDACRMALRSRFGPEVRISVATLAFVSA